jgi:transcriptional regulator with XRE-family HTH domain
MYEKVQYLCDERNIKLAHLCKEANIPKSTLSELKQGRTKTLSTSTLSKIANEFNTTVDNIKINNSLSSDVINIGDTLII